MQRKGENFYDRGPGFALAEDETKSKEKKAGPEDEVYVFCTSIVDAGDGKPIPAGQFVKVKAKRIPVLQSIARQNRGYLNVMPYGWTPKELDI